MKSAGFIARKVDRSRKRVALDPKGQQPRQPEAREDGQDAADADHPREVYACS